MSFDPHAARRENDLRDEFSDAHKDRQDLYRGDGTSWRTNYRPPMRQEMACHLTPEYQRINSEACDAQMGASRAGVELAVLIDCQERLRNSAEEWRDEAGKKRLKAAAQSLHRFIAEAKRELDAFRGRLKAAHEARIAMETAEHDANRAANPDRYMGHYLGQYVEKTA